jgi:hypothetical protein
MKVEYRVVTIYFDTTPKELEEQLDAHGETGWKLITPFTLYQSDEDHRGDSYTYKTQVLVFMRETNEI